MNAQEFEIVFYEAMAKWAAGRKIGPDPRGEWELRDICDTSWVNSCGMPQFEADTQYRWKPAKKRTVTIDGVELVAPEVEAPEIGTKIFVEVVDGKIAKWTWDGVEPDQGSLANGKVFLTREDAQAMADVQRKQRLGGSV